MEDCQNLEVIAWSDKQNAFTNNYLNGPEYDELYQQISEAYSSEYYSMSYFDEDIITITTQVQISIINT